MTNDIYSIGDVFIHIRSGKRVKIFETKRTQEMSEIVTRYRMATDDRWLTADQVRAEYGRELQPERGR